MLVLSRQKNQTIMIGDIIEITVVDIRGEKVRLGITAPPEIPVHRKEVYEAIQQENRQAATVRLEDIAKAARPRPGAGEAEPGAPPLEPEKPQPEPKKPTEA